MRINWIRLTLGVLILTSLSLFLFGCGRSGGNGFGGAIGNGSAPYTNKLSGRVSDPTTGRGVANATVTAYAVSANGVVTSTVLSYPTTARTDSLGNYTLNIISPYSGMIMVVATIPGATQPVRALVSPSGAPASLSSAMVSLASEMTVEYIIQNMGGSFTALNLQTATRVLEPFFGLNYLQTPPPVPGTTPTKPQQDLLVMTQAINALVNSIPTTTSALVTVNPASGLIQLGTQPTLGTLQTTIPIVADILIKAGEIPGGYLPPPITPIPQPPPGQTDTTIPTPPANLQATTTSTTVTLTWGAATDNIGVTAYYIYRDGNFIGSVASPALTFTDTLAFPSTAYTYVVTARDAAGNISNGASIMATTLPPPTVNTYIISGNITVNGVPTKDVPVLLSGLGSGVALTDASGNYSFTGAINGVYTITPTLTGQSFNPLSITVIINNADSINNNFTSLPDGSVTGGVIFPDATIIGTVVYPAGTVIGGVTYPTAVIIGSVIYPSGSVQGVIVYPAGTIVGGITFPAGTIIGGVVYPAGTIVGGVFYPSGSIVGGVLYPAGTIVGGVFYPAGTVIGGVTYPGGTIIGGVSFPAGTVVGGLTFPPGSLSGTVFYPPASISGTPTFPVSGITGTLSYPPGGITGTLLFP